MYIIRIHFDNNDHIDTRINGNIDTIVNYYLDHKFPFLTKSGKETTATARCVEFLDSVPVIMCGKEYRLVRIYSVSDKMMKNYQLDNRFRLRLKKPVISPSAR